MFKKNKNRAVPIDYSRMIYNRRKMFEIACWEYDYGLINKTQFRALAQMFHPDFNSGESIPEECRAETQLFHQIDRRFWNTYKLSVDFVIDCAYVYLLYKANLFKELNIND